MTSRTLRSAACGLIAAVACGVAAAQDSHQHVHQHGAAAAADSAPPPFVASTAKPFAQLMGDAMAVMDYGMRKAPMNGQPEHDFVTMMIPHHQGAVDMAKALLLTTKDPELRNLAQGILAEQQIEIQLMNAWLKAHPQANQ
ncbi:MAG TPA: DUF305 domain-containing protein [Telluria sp.]|nr:DUF305 domain-containing protein [Telluria sp.]